MRVVALLVVSAAASSVLSDGERSAADAAANPIRRVVNLLTSMQKKVEAEGKKEKEMFDKFMCYCKNAGSSLSAAIDAAGTKIPQVASSIKEGESSKTQLEQELKDHQVSRAEAKSAMAKATALREKEAAAFAKESGDAKTNIAAMGKAITAIESGMSGSFLQSTSAQAVQRVAIDTADMTNYDRRMLLAFLTGKSEDGYAPASGQITGILKEMKDTMDKDLADITASETASVQTFGELMAAKTKEVDANTQAIEEKTVRVGNLGVEIEGMKNDLDDTQQQLLEDKDFLANMDTNCSEKEKEWEVICAMRSQELIAIADTIKILNDDDALELFKKTLPAADASLVQVVSQSAHVVHKALTMVQQVRKDARKDDHAALDLIALALTGKKVNFDKVIGLVDGLVATLQNEQKDDDHKREYCLKQFDFTDDKKKGLEQNLADLETTIEDTTEKIATLTDELKALAEGIVTLDKEVKESTETRKEEHEEHTELLAGNNAAMDLLGVAKNRLNKFYNPKLYKAPPKRVLTEEERITENMGGASFVQIGSHRLHKADPGPAPEAPKKFEKKSEQSSGVVAMIDMLIADLDRETQEATVIETESQKEYEKFMKDAAMKRITDSKAITDKEGAKADGEVALEAAKEEKMSKFKELMATEKYIGTLHMECDWLIKNFDLRKEARVGEIDSLKKAKAVLAGADFSLMERTSDVTRSLRGSA